MKVVNTKTNKEYHVTPEGWEKIKAKGLAGRYRVVQETKAFQPRELKIVEAKTELKSKENKKSEE